MSNANNWKDIWNKKKIDDLSGLNENEILNSLIKADGYDLGSILTVDYWKKYVNFILGKINIPKGGSIYEVGCGSGAFLYPMHIQGYKTGGIDYAEPLINVVKNIIPNGDFEVNEAVQMDTTKKYDAVVSNGLFLYFPSLEYAHSVLKKMYDKANDTIAILELTNNRFREATENERKARISDYDEKYKGLGHIYFDKKWFLDFAEEHDCRIELFDQQLEYENSRYRFNCIMHKMKR